jgi:ligand-binding sensor domain-containing protein
MQVFRLYFSFCCLLIFQFVSAQEPVYRHFTSQNGLPSSEIYDAIQSEEGYIWFATNFGVARFDGLNFKIFDRQDGLPRNTIFNAQKDPSGRIWFNAFNGTLAYWDGKKIQPYRYNDQLSSYIKSLGIKTTVFVSYDIKSDGSILFDLYGKGQHLILNDGTINKVKKSEDSCFFDLNLIDNGKVLFNSSINYNRPTLRIVKGDSIFVTDNPVNGDGFLTAVLFKSFHKDNLVFFSYNNVLTKMQNGKSEIVYQFDYRIASLKMDNFGRLWVGTINGGVFVFDDYTKNTKPTNYLNGNSISSIYFDHEDGIWVTSTNNGVFYYPTLNINKFTIDTELASNRINAMEIDPFGRIWLGLDRGYLLSIDTNNHRKMYEVDAKNEVVISKLKWDKHRNLLLIGTNIRMYFLEKEVIKPHKDNYVSKKSGEAKSFSAMMDITQNEKTGDFWIGKYNGITCFTQNGNVTYNSLEESGFDERVEAIAVDQSGDVMLGSLNGLWQYKNGKFIHFDSINPMLGERITVIDKMHDTLLLGTRGNGLLILTSDSLYQLTRANGLPGNSINTMSVGDGVIFAGTNQGVCIIKRKNIVSKPDVITITASTGLTSNEISAVSLRGNMVYVGTSEGLNMFNLSSFKPSKTHFPLVITDITVNDKSADIQEDLQIKFKNNAIEIDYFAISFRNKGKITYRHRLLGLNDEWIENQLTSAQFPYLPAGKYTFEVNARNLNGDWNPEPSQLSFVILKPYWQTWWFISLLVFFLVAALWIVYSMRIKVVKQKNQMLQDIYKYQQEALIGQMNPHFLFNALNTVQRYILENDKIASSKYLSKFAGLMRKTLENSQNKQISIQSEMDALNLYLELESARFKNKFEFTIEASVNFNPATAMIPVFIIQPLVENAIWHGLMVNEKPGILKVLFERQKNDLLCKVIDNGIGRKAAALMGNHKDKHSLGISIIRKRLKLLNTQEKKQIQIQYTDLINEAGVASGTEVIVYFPQFFNETI